MEKITIKPHHFMDIIKLYGSGLEVFVPDEKIGHDFYKIGNIILNDKNQILKLTIDNDDICCPCKHSKNGKCMDSLDKIMGYEKKDDYNKILDKRIIALFELDLTKEYRAFELCQIYLSNSQYIYDVWKEENIETTKKRHDLFVKGAKKYIVNTTL